jgi:hypothetical protein
MKLERVETPDYILAVSDEEKKIENCYLYNTITKNIRKCFAIDRNRLVYNEFDFVIIAYQPKGNAPELDLPLLPKIVIEDDVEKLAESYKNKKGSIPTTELEDEIFKLGFKDGHKAATKVYSEDDLIRVAIHCWNIASRPEYGKTYNVNEIVLNYIQSLKQPKWFIAEMDYLSDTGEWKHVLLPSEWKTDTQTRLKTTTINGKTYLVGTYLNE